MPTIDEIIANESAKIDSEYADNPMFQYRPSPIDSTIANESQRIDALTTPPPPKREPVKGTTLSIMGDVIEKLGESIKQKVNAYQLAAGAAKSGLVRGLTPEKIQSLFPTAEISQYKQLRDQYNGLIAKQNDAALNTHGLPEGVSTYLSKMDLPQPEQTGINDAYTNRDTFNNSEYDRQFVEPSRRVVENIKNFTDNPIANTIGLGTNIASQMFNIGMMPISVPLAAIRKVPSIKIGDFSIGGKEVADALELPFKLLSEAPKVLGRASEKPLESLGLPTDQDIADYLNTDISKVHEVVKSVSDLNSLAFTLLGLKLAHGAIKGKKGENYKQEDLAESMRVGQKALDRLSKNKPIRDHINAELSRFYKPNLTDTKDLEVGGKELSQEGIKYFADRLNDKSLSENERKITADYLRSQGIDPIGLTTPENAQNIGVIKGLLGDRFNSDKNPQKQSYSGEPKELKSNVRKNIVTINGVDVPRGSAKKQMVFYETKMREAENLGREDLYNEAVRRRDIFKNALEGKEPPKAEGLKVKPKAETPKVETKPKAEPIKPKAEKKQPAKKPKTKTEEIEALTNRITKKGGKVVGSYETTAGTIVEYQLKGDKSNRQITAFNKGGIATGVYGKRLTPESSVNSSLPQGGGKNRIVKDTAGRIYEVKGTEAPYTLKNVDTGDKGETYRDDLIEKGAPIPTEDITGYGDFDKELRQGEIDLQYKKDLDEINKHRDRIKLRAKQTEDFLSQKGLSEADVKSMQKKQRAGLNKEFKEYLSKQSSLPKGLEAEKVETAPVKRSENQSPDAGKKVEKKPYEMSQKEYVAKRMKDNGLNKEDVDKSPAGSPMRNKAADVIVDAIDEYAESVEEHKKEVQHRLYEQWQKDKALAKKEPYKFTENEYIKLSGVTTRSVIKRQQLRRKHFASVKKALKEGKQVPDKVLKDYPELQKKPTEPVKKSEVGLGGSFKYESQGGEHTVYVTKGNNEPGKPYEVHTKSLYSKDNSEYDNIYTSVKTLDEANQWVEHLRQERNGAKTKPPNKRLAGAKANGFLRRSAEIELSKAKSRDKDYEWSIVRDRSLEPLNDSRPRFVLEGKLKTEPAKQSVTPLEKKRKPSQAMTKRTPQSQEEAILQHFVGGGSIDPRSVMSPKEFREQYGLTKFQVHAKGQPLDTFLSDFNLTTKEQYNSRGFSEERAVLDVLDKYPTHQSRVEALKRLQSGEVEIPEEVKAELSKIEEKPLTELEKAKAKLEFAKNDIFGNDDEVIRLAKEVEELEKAEDKFKESLNEPGTKKEYREALSRTPEEIEDVKKSVDNKEKAGEEAGAYEEVSNFFKAKAAKPTTEKTEAGDQYTLGKATKISFPTKAKFEGKADKSEETPLFSQKQEDKNQLDMFKGGKPKSSGERKILTLKGIVKEEFDVKSNKDKRVRVNRTLAEYEDANGDIYRKAFESKGKPNVPKSGTNKELNSQKTQYGEKPKGKGQELHQKQATSKPLRNLSPKQRRAELLMANRLLPEDFTVKFDRNIKDENGSPARGLTDLENNKISINPDLADETTTIHEVTHGATKVILMQNPKRGRALLRLNGWDGKGDPFDISGNKSATDAWESLGKKAEDYFTDEEKFMKEEPRAKWYKEVFDKLKQLWESVRNWAKGKGFVSEAKFYDDMIKGKFHKVKGVSPFDEPQFALQKLKDAFYSKVEKLVGDKAPGKNINADQLTTMLEKNGAKKEELEWLDIKTYLKENPKATKKDLLNFIKENNVKLEVITISGKRGEGIEEVSNWDDYLDEDLPPDDYDELTEDWTDPDTGNLILINGGEDYTQQFWDKWSYAFNQEFYDNFIEPNEFIGDNTKYTKYSKYTEPGGQNYREILLTVPTEKVNVKFIVEKKPQPSEYQWTVRLSTQTEHQKSFKTEKEARDYAKRQNSVSYVGYDSKTTFKSPHYEEPNIIVHIRVDDRTDTQNRKILFLEENQSDWHEEGRQKGYKQKPLSKLPDDVEILRTEYPELYDVKYRGHVFSVRVDDPKNVDKGALSAINSQLLNTGVPNAPFKKSWHELGLKYALRYAAENGYDGIAWTTGQMQADRYDLSKQVDFIKYKKLQSNKYEINVSGVDNIPSIMGTDDLEKYFGKDIAQRILDDKGLTIFVEPGVKILKDDDLKVGGEGMKGFYDRMLPSFLNKYAKKWGARVGETEIDKLGNVPFLPITEKMKTSVLNGQPLFQKGYKINDKRAVKKVSELETKLKAEEEKKPTPKVTRLTTTVIKEKIRNIMQGHRLGRYDALEEFKKLKKATLDYAKKTLPPTGEYRRSELLRMSKADTPQKLLKDFEKIEELARKVSVRTYKKKVIDLVKSRSKIGKTRKAADASIFKFADDVINGKVKELDSDAPKLEQTVFELLNDFKNAEPQQLEVAYNMLKDLKEADIAKLKEEREQNKIAKENYQQNLFSDMGIKSDEIPTTDEGIKSRRKKQKGGVVSSIRTTGDTFGHITKGKTNIYDSVTRQAYNRISMAFSDNQFLYSEKFNKKLNNLRREHFGSLREHYGGTIKRPTGLKFVENGIESDLLMSKSEVAKRVMEWEEDYGRKTLERMGYTQELVDKMKDYIGKDWYNYAKDIRDNFLTEMSKDISDHFKKMYGFDLPQTKNWVSHLGDGGDKQNVEQGISTVPSYLKLRTGKARTFLLESMDDMAERIIKGNAHAKNADEMILFYRAMQSNKVRKAFELKGYGEDYKQMMEMLGNEVSLYPKRGGLKSIDRAIANITRAIVISPKQILKQWMSFDAYTFAIPTREFAKLKWRNILNGAETAKWVLKNMPYVRKRLVGNEGWSYATSTLMDYATSNSFWDRLIRAGRDEMVKSLPGIVQEIMLEYPALKNAQMIFTKIGDIIPVIVGSKSAYDYRYKQIVGEMGHEKAHYESVLWAEKLTNDFQQSAEWANRNWLLQQSNARIFAAFKQASMAYSVPPLEVLDIAKKNPVEAARITKTWAKLLLKYAIISKPALALAFLAAINSGSNEEIKKASLEIMKETAYAGGNVPFIGDAISIGRGYEGTALYLEPMKQAVEEYNRVYRKGMRKVRANKITDKERMMNISLALSQYFGLPLKTVVSIYKETVTDKKSLGQFIMALIGYTKNQREIKKGKRGLRLRPLPKHKK